MKTLTFNYKNRLIEISKVNNEKWITIKPHGQDAKGRHLMLQDGETPKEAMKRQWGVDVDKKNNGKEEIQIEKETRKALLIKKSGKTFWIQKKWMRKDGTLTPAGEQAFKNASTDEEKKKRETERKEKWEKGVSIPRNPDYESDKAYGFDLNLDFYDRDRNVRHRLFIPKSVIKNGRIPSWLLKKKFEEIEEKYPYSRYGGFNVDNHPFNDDEIDVLDLGTMVWKDTDTKNEVIKTSNSVHSIIANKLVIMDSDALNEYNDKNIEESLEI